MAEHSRPLYEEVLDYAVYAPIGVVLKAVEALPGMVEKGRAQLGGRMKMANVLGRFAATAIKRKIDETVGQVRERPAAQPSEDGEPSANDDHVTSEMDRHVSELEANALPIAGYDSLAASQVVARLGGLSPDELRAIKSYESTHRARRTILLRIAQLEDTAH
jgi:hypothetical protein